MPHIQTAMPCKRRVCHSHPVRSWLMDTGCGFDLVQKSAVSSCTDCFRPMANPASLNTANGEVEVQHCLPLSVGCGLPSIEALVLDSTPAVLSIGRRCMHEGYSFEWHAFSKPFLRNPDGFTVELDVVDNIPYLNLDSQACRGAQIAMPASGPPDVPLPAPPPAPLLPP